MAGVFVTVDFEGCDQGGCRWLAFAVVAVAYPSRRRCFAWSVNARRAFPEDFDAPTLRFWRRHPHAFKLNARDAVAPALAERQIVATMTYVRRRFARAVFVSDNPQYDMRLLSNILVAHRQLPICHRGPRGYVPTVCTWSFRRAAQASGLSLAAPKAAKSGVAHTPLADCAQILAAHMALLDALAKKPWAVPGVRPPRAANKSPRLKTHPDGPPPA